MNYSVSKELYERANSSVPGGVHSNSRFRNPHPLYYKKADGAMVWDVDGNRFIDCIMGNGAIIFGHNDQAFNERMAHYMSSGIVTGLETELSIQAAEKFLSIVKTAERVRYTNTGTEATMHTMLMARTYTGKPHVAVIEGAYNGWHDAVYVSTWPDLMKAGEHEAPKSLPGTSGLMKEVVESTLVIPFNDLAVAEKLLTDNQDRIAALILEPTMIDIGYIPAKKEYLQGLRRLCDQLNIVLVFDELLTGFRDAPGGAQEYYGVTPDLATFGKAIANGYMLAAIAGKEKIFDTVTPGKGTCSYIGTFNGHQVSLAASMAFMELYEEQQVFETLQRRTNSLISEFDHLAKKHGVPAVIKGRGGHFHWYFSEKQPTNYREAAATNKEHYAQFIKEFAAKGIYCSPNYLLHHAISMAHDDAVVETLLTCMDQSLATIRTDSLQC
ncbi:aspartate aminotransferase family protein [Paenibacillus planticolens]|uniref:Aminotransferase class III-fold pyridoxal phosphate-dependent enzyme n=1 Tax=Paenibacillus planticolens TaxID=2654976 RepID=A0ABX1ZKJ3_9BACL|nr:aspartate aminotransferase family protein [Paenibacillus planticolens]NOU99462.1 aminotransferase class III-fold pyridoxal phosphate-dependent enzyme [Paenibacillus planticolens]